VVAGEAAIANQIKSEPFNPNAINDEFEWANEQPSDHWGNGVGEIHEAVLAKTVFGIGVTINSVSIVLCLTGLIAIGNSDKWSVVQDADKLVSPTGVSSARSRHETSKRPHHIVFYYVFYVIFFI
jgi:hypothetical protein